MMDQKNSPQGLIVYTSRTGNTEAVAKAIHSVLPGFDLKTVPEVTPEEVAAAPCVIFGFWVDRGTAAAPMKALMEQTEGKEVAFFATLGADPQGDHAKRMLENIQTLLAAGNNHVRCQFHCQGRIDQTLMARRMQVDPSDPHYPTPERLKSWTKGLNHPDESDFDAAKACFAAEFGANQ
ncbi:hypothetical protein ABB02_01301 [Clostridiaceae bacterium JG1575]|nr:hypothetical protein ABB02_01301 [Clostridiaceae bacterium JG1575]